MRSLLVMAAVTAAGLSPAFADSPPPNDAKPLSEIVRQIEQKPDFRYIDEIDFDDGAYDIEYYTKDGAEHEVRIDPGTGNKQ